MNGDSLEMISALFDGEPVDPVALSALLAGSEGRSALVDFAMLRARVLADTEEPQPGFADEVRSRIAAASRPPLPRLLRLAAAAVVLMAAFLGGFWLGERGPASASVVPVPDSTRVVKFVPGEDWSPEQ